MQARAHAPKPQCNIMSKAMASHCCTYLASKFTGYKGEECKLIERRAVHLHWLLRMYSPTLHAAEHNQSTRDKQVLVSAKSQPFLGFLGYLVECVCMAQDVTWTLLQYTMRPDQQLVHGPESPPIHFKYCFQETQFKSSDFRGPYDEQ